MRSPITLPHALHGWAEAEYVRLELTLHRAKNVHDDGFIASVRKLRTLSRVVGPTFRYLVGRDVAGCAGVRWAFRCPASWAAMAPTDDANERVCTSCRQLVVQVTTEREATRLAREGVCAQVRVDEEEWVGDIEPEPDERPRARRR